MRVTVIGGTGVLGRRVVPLLLNQGHQVTAPARSGAAAARLPGARTPVGDLWDPEFLREQLTGAEAVIMLATAIPIGSAAARPRAWRTNTRIRSELAPLVAQLAQEAGVQVLVQESVLFVYADGGQRLLAEDAPVAPPPPVAACLVAEAAAANFAGRGVALRFAQFVAPDSAHTREVWGLAERGRALVFGHPHDYLTFVHADDAAAAVVHALEVPSGIYNVGAEPVTRAAWLASLAGRTGRRVVPPPVLVRRILPRLVPPVRTLERSIRLDSGALLATGWAPRHATNADVWRHSR